MITSVTEPSVESTARRQQGRTARHVALRDLRKITRLKGPAMCQTAIAGAVGVGVVKGVAHVTGIFRCGSPWSCVVCAPTVREFRAGEIDRALSSWLALGGGAEFVTLTLPHDQGDKLRRSLATVTEGFTRCVSGRTWAGGWRQRTIKPAAADLLPWLLACSMMPGLVELERRPNGKVRVSWWEGGMKSALGVVGQIKAVEITVGANGWHPHVHALMVTQAPLTELQRVELRRHLYSVWSAHCVAEGWRKPSKMRGVDVRPVTDAAELSGYLTKVVGGWGAGHELARTDVKAARRLGSRAPFQVLGDFLATGDADDLELWHEYEAATFGVRSLTWSPGLRSLMGVGDELTDEEVAALEGEAEADVTVTFDAERWNGFVRAGTVGIVLADVERWAENRSGPPPWGGTLVVTQQLLTG